MSDAQSAPTDFVAQLKALQEAAQAELPNALAEVDRTQKNIEHAKDEHAAAVARLNEVRGILPKPPRAPRGSKKAVAKK